MYGYACASVYLLNVCGVCVWVCVTKNATANSFHVPDMFKVKPCAATQIPKAIMYGKMDEKTDEHDDDEENDTSLAVKNENFLVSFRCGGAIHSAIISPSHANTRESWIYYLICGYCSR